MTRVSLFAAATTAVAALIATMPATAQIGVRSSSQTSASSDDAIIVQGQKKEIAKALRDLIKPSGGAEQLARFEDDICPLVAGMPRDWTAVLTRMIRDNVVAVGGKVAAPKPGKKCSVT